MKSTILLMLITILAKVSGFLRELVFGYLMGTNAVKDVYVIANSIPSVLFGFVASAVYSAYVPTYTKVNSTRGRKEADEYTANLSNILLVVATVIVVIFLIFTEPVVKLFASGFKGKTLQMAINFTRIVIFTIYATAFNAPFKGFLNYHDNFVIPAITPIVQNACLVIAAIVAIYMEDWMVLAYGYLASYFIMYFPYYFSLKKENYTHKKIIDFSNVYIKETIRLGLPIILTIATTDIASIIDKNIATTLFENGGVSSLDYADKIIQLVKGVVISSVVVAAYPKLSKLAQAKEYEKLKSSVKNSIVSTLAIVIPASFGLFVLAEPVIKLIFERGAFDANSTLSTGGALRWYSLALIGEALYMILVRVFYVLGDIKTPFKIILVQVMIDIPLNFILSGIMGLNGLALSSSIGILAAGGYSIYQFNKKTNSRDNKEALINVFKIVIASLIMSLVAVLTYKGLQGLGNTLATTISIIFAAVVYLIIISFLKIQEIDDMELKIKNKMKDIINKHKE